MGIGDWVSLLPSKFIHKTPYKTEICAFLFYQTINIELVNLLEHKFSGLQPSSFSSFNTGLVHGSLVLLKFQ